MHDLQYEWRHIVVTALAFTAGVAWNKAFEDMFSRVPYLKNNGSFIYAVLLSVIIVVIILKVKPPPVDAK